ncbi:MAG: glycine cleavage system protein H [Bacteroidales bacterium]|jgi:glycine cleavage system H protein|nr:glycine cleavage system protein H [Bacteroidales bacterium]
MDGFSYHDIFQTKGIEYIIIIAFLLLLIPFWAIINKRAVIARNIRKAIGILTLDKLNIPRGIFFSNNHMWTHLEKSGAAKVGMDDLLLHITGEVNLNFRKEPEDKIRKGDLLAEIDQDGKQLKVFAPISGKILDMNPLVHETPGILNEDPYGDGWICKIQPDNWVEETGSYYLADEAVRWSKAEIERFKDFIAVSMGKYSPEPGVIILQEGGEIADKTLSRLPAEIWLDFQKEFLDRPV